MTTCNLSKAKQLNFLNSLSIKEKEKLNANSEMCQIRKGSVVFVENEQLQKLFFINEGACKFSVFDDKGKEHITRLLGKGDLMGRRSLITKKGALVTATAISDTTLCCLDKSALLKNLERNNNFCIDVLRGFLSDFEDQEFKMKVYQNRQSIQKRLAGLLLYMRTKFGLNADGSLRITLKREDMANILGTSSEYIITILTRFKKAHLVALKKGKITIISDNQLRTFL
ncbi:Crp/Fnr family transcriptional regulator [Maribacter sp. MJ134]|uniref:Crp/Fnr family transcriptional regulator n=1 Tax=Maribacter sp. MJ134 TaxID=2496865 RepID=UPI000F82A5C9|nr:Crp/Fnr family transcriptional regulator [Maribacter sp. MJ134]AZQ59271.1 Crp/Fnr family transcriptional regulator [Maribacter sp. MJ134]